MSAPSRLNRLSITENAENNTANRIAVQDEITGEIGWISKDSIITDLVIEDYDPQAGVIEDGDTIQLAIEKLDGNLQNAAIYLPEQGVIINDDFNRASLGSNYTNVGTGTFSIVSNKLQASYSGGFSANQYILYNAYGNCNLESFTLTADVIAGTINSTSYGVTVVLQSNGSFNLIPGGKNSIKIGISLDSANLGKIAIYNNNDNSSTFISKTGLAISTGDLLNLVVKFIKDKFIITLLNTVTGNVNVFEYDIYNSSPYGIITPNAFRFGIGCLGGTHLVDNLNVFSNDSVGISYLLCGDSITKGLSTDNIVNRWGELLNNNTTTSTQTNAGGGNCIEDLNANEIIALEPKNIILLIGINNFQAGNDQLTVRSKYQVLVNSLVSAGYIIGTNLFLATLIPYFPFASSVSAFNTWLFATYGTSACIDFFNPLANGSALRYTIDQIHPDNEGHRIMANVVINKFNLPSRIKKVGALYPVIYNNNGKLIIGTENSRSSTPLYRLEVIDTDTGLNTGATMRFGNSILDNGGYLFSNQADSAGIFAGMNYTASGFMAKANNVGGILCVNGDCYMYSQKTTTPGVLVVPVVRVFISGTNGNVGINTISPSASAQLQIDSTTKGFLKPRLTTTQRDAISSPVEGLEVFNTTSHRNSFYDGSKWMEIQGRSIVSASTPISLPLNFVEFALIFKGTSNITVTVPSVSSTIGNKYIIINKSTTSNITLNSTNPNEFWDSGTLQSSTTCAPGATMEIYNDSENFIIL